MFKWPHWLFLLVCLSFGGCLKNETGDNSLLRAGEAPRMMCEGLTGEKTEVLFSLLPDRYKKKTSIKNLWILLKLPKGIPIRSCRLTKLSSQITRERRDEKGKVHRFPRAKGTYALWDDKNQVIRMDFYFIKEKGKWWLLPTYDNY